MIDLTQKVRLEVEVPTTGLPNLVKNPNGELGGWGWLTPVANTTMGPYISYLSPNTLRFQTKVTQAAYFTTELLPVAAGKYVAARYEMAPNNSSTQTHKARFDFYDSNKTLISSSTQTGYQVNTAGTIYYIPSAQAPAGTVYVTLRLDAYGDGAGAAFPSNSSVYLKNVMVTWADTSAGLGSTRTNLITNPSIETSTLGWVYDPSAGSGTIARSTTFGGYVGSMALRIGSDSGGSGVGRASMQNISVVGGQDYTLSFYYRATTGGVGTIRGNVQWYNASGGFIGASLTTYGPASTTSWQRWTGTVTAPSDAATATILIGATNGGQNVSDYHYYDAIMMEQGSTVGDYFDGSTTGTGVTYAWTGTTNLSTSTATYSSTTYAYSEPIAWQNILGPTSDINISRKELDVGLLTATLYDAMLDPAAANSIIKPGKQIRVTAYDGSKWRPLYTGKITNGQTSYDPTTPGKAGVEVKLTASDNIAQLSNQGENRVLKAIDDLPYVFEGKGVPWNVNGNYGHVNSATVVAYNENASVVDQIAVTRDTNRGYAWVGPDNVTNVFTSLPVPSMSGFNGTFDTDINGWVASAGCTIARDTTTFRTGGASLAMTSTSTSSFMARTTNNVYPTRQGVTYTISGYMRAGGTTPRGAGVGLQFYRADGTFIEGVINTPTTSNAGWTFSTLTLTAPAGAAYVAPTAYATTASVGEVFYVDDVTVTMTPPVNLTDATGDSKSLRYSDIDVNYNTDDCINSVTVKWLRYDVGSGQTTEIIYGPYEDAASIAQWGPHAKEVTIAGAASDENATFIQNFANSVLAANATPETRVLSATVPIVDTTAMTTALDLDLYMPVPVTFQTKFVGKVHRVTSIEHNITADGWDVTLGFADTDSVAAPTWVPSPGFNGVTLDTPSAFRVGPVLIQTGYVDPADVTTTAQTGTVTFPKAFSGEPTFVSLQMLAPGWQPRHMAVTSKSATNFGWVQNWYDNTSHSMGTPFMWIAVGPA